MSIRHTPGASYGWRARVGMLKPTPVIDNNAYEFYLVAPEGVELFVTALGIPVGYEGQSEDERQEQYSRAVADLDGPLGLLLEHELDSIVQAGVPPVVAMGWGAEEELKARIAMVTDLPYFTDVGATLAALHAVGASSMVMLGFGGRTAEHVHTYFGHAGIPMLASAVQKDPNNDAARIPLEAVYRAARDLFVKDGRRAEAIWITPAARPSLGVIELLEQDLGIPVVSSAQALIWAGLRSAGVTDEIAGYGQLFQRQLPE
jgi:maleate isomerase